MQVFVLNKDTRKYFTGLYDASVFPDSEDNMIMLGAVESNKPIGILCSTVFLKEVAVQWVFVDEKYRRKKVASNLFKALIQTVTKCGAEDIYLFITQDNKDFIAFLKSMDFAIRSNAEWVNYETRLSDIHSFPEEEIEGYKLSSFMTVGKKLVSGLNEHLIDGESVVGVPLRIDPRDFSPFSCCSVIGDHISSLILVHTRMESGKDVLELPWIYIGSDAKRSAPAMYNASLNALKASFDPGTTVRFSCMSKAVNKMITSVVPDAKQTEIFTAFKELKR